MRHFTKGFSDMLKEIQAELGPDFNVSGGINYNVNSGEARYHFNAWKDEKDDSE